MICPYAVNAADTGTSIGGRIVNYLPCKMGFIEGGVELHMQRVEREIEAHPECEAMVAGVSKFSGGRESMHLTIELKIGVPGCVCVARWSNQVPLIVANLPDKRR